MLQLIHRILWFLVLVLVQVLVLNHVHIAGYATPVLYIYYILTLNSETTRVSLLLQGFFLGLCVDVFSNTPGVNAAACTLLAFVRTALLRMQMVRDITDDYEPGIRIMGFSPFLRYVTSGTFLMVLVWQLIDIFSLFRIEELFWRVLSSTFLSVILIMCIDAVRRKR